MTKTKKVGSSGRLGARYGVSVRRRLANIESQSKALYECSRCGRRRVRRKSVGLWSCSKCGYIFAGGAYRPSTKMGEVAARAARGIQE
ncbi:50S ribosomal protein L37ae [Candidatus Bathyarchaeota archaeon]|nr:50S ribosomal protein L37ae [Candidatus Bathyarchaeota archaeon]